MSIVDLERRIKALEEKVEEVVNAYNRHKHRISLSGASEQPTYPVKKKRSEK